MAMGVRVPVLMAVGIGRNHGKMLYYNITGVYRCRFVASEAGNGFGQLHGGPCGTAAASRFTPDGEPARGRPVAVGVAVVMTVAVGSGWNHEKMLYYNITGVHRGPPPYGLPIAIAMAAARNGNGSDTAARNQTNRAGMNGISHNSSRWKANSAHAIT